MSSDTDTIALKIQVRDDGSMVITNLQKKIKKSTGAVNEFEKGSKKLHGSLGSLWKQFTIGHLAADVFRSGLQAIKQTIHGVIQSVSGFEKEFANVTTLLTNETMAAAVGMQEGLFNMAGELGSTIELTKGLYQTLSAGVEPGVEALGFLEASAKFAKAGLVDMSSSVDVLSTVINAYGLQTKEVTEVSDILFQTIKDGKITGQELASSFGDVINTAAQMGVNIKEVSSAITIMTKTGIKSAEATTALNQALMGVLGASPQIIQAAKKMGIEFSRLGIEAAGGLQKWLKKISDVVGDNKEKLKELFPNIRGLKSVMALAGEQAENYANQMKRMDDVTDNVQEAFEKQIATFEGAKSAISNMAEAAFQKALLPALQELATWIRGNKEDIITFFKTLAFVIKGVVDTVKLLIDGFSKLPTFGFMTAANKIMNDQMRQEAEAILKQREAGSEFIKSGFGVISMLNLLRKGYKEAETFLTKYTKNVIEGTHYTDAEAKTIKKLGETISDLKHEVYGYTEYSDEARTKIQALNAEIKKLIKLSDTKPKYPIVDIPDSFQQSVRESIDQGREFEETLKAIGTASIQGEDGLKKMYENGVDPYTQSLIDAEAKQEAFRQSIIKLAGDINQIGQSLLGLGESLGLDTGKFESAFSDLTSFGANLGAALAGDPTAIVGAISSGIDLIGSLFDLFEGKDPVEEAIEDWNTLIEEGKEGTYEMWEFLHRDYVLLGEEIEEIMDYQQEKIHEGLEALSDYYEYAATSQKRFNHAQIYTMAIFSGLVASGYTFVEAIREMKDEFGQLLDIIAETGYTADESFQFLLNIADFIEQNEALANALSSVSIMLKSAFESGALSLTQLQAMIYTAGADFTSMYHEAITAGATQEEAYALIADPLSDLIFYATEHNLKIDDQTASLIAEMQAAGYLTELQIPEDVKQTWLLEEMLKIMGGTIPYLLGEINSSILQEVHDGGVEPGTDNGGQIIKEYAGGGEFWTTGPQYIEVGEGPEIEHVKITPKSRYHGAGATTGGGVQIGEQHTTLIVDSLVMQPGEDAGDFILKVNRKLDRNEYGIKNKIQGIAIQAVENRLAGD